jgi:sugar O-acyltransferase (sialic acid O-acetyltransferase NeuD family)
MRQKNHEVDKMDTKKNLRERSLLVLGAGGLALEVYEIVQQSGEWQAVAFLDDGAANPHGLNVIGTISSLQQWRGQFTHALPAVGNCKVRVEWLKNAQEAGFEIPSVIHPSAAISASAIIGAGCIILCNAVVAAKVKLGDGVLVNHGVLIDHECTIEDGVHLGMGCVVRGGARVEALRQVRPLSLIE